jgi:hypothetical protein
MAPMVSRPQWKLYEELAHRIFTELLPFADVKLDDHIQGAESESKRQIDVSARWTDPDGDDRLLVVQVKDYKSRADVNVVGEFRSVLLDVRASRGILICSGGFSKSAKTYAANLGISLYTLHDAESVQWSRQLTVAIVRGDIALVKSSMSLHLAGYSESAGQLDLNRVTADGGETELSLLAAITDMWNQGDLPYAPGHHSVHPPQELLATFRSMDGTAEKWAPLGEEAFEIEYETTATYFLRHVIPTESRGIIDALDNDAYWPTRLTLSPDDVGPPPPEIAESKDWMPITDPERLAIESKGIVMTLTNTPILDSKSAVFRIGSARFTPAEHEAARAARSGP